MYMEKYSFRSYVVVDNKNQIVLMDSSIKCIRMANKMNTSNAYISEHKPYKAKYIDTTFNI